MLVDVVIGLILAGALTVVTIPVVSGLTRESRKEKARQKELRKYRAAMSDETARAKGLDKYEEKESQSIALTSVEGSKKYSVKGIVNTMFHPEEDILLKGKFYDTSIDGSSIEEDIYLYQPCVTIEGRKVKPRIKNGKLSDDLVYSVKDGSDVYTFYLDKREVSSGLPFDYVTGSSHGKKSKNVGLSVHLDFKPVDLSDPVEKRKFEKYMEDRRLDGVDNRDRYQSKIDNSKVSSLVKDVEERFRVREVQKKEKRRVPQGETERDIYERRIRLTQRMNDMKHVGIMNQHGDHVDIGGNHQDSTDGRGRG